MEQADKLDALIDGAEELLTKLTDTNNPEVRRLRDRVDAALRDARRAVANRSDGGSVQIRDIVSAVDDYIRDYPWLAVATGVLVAGGVAFIAGATIGAKRGIYREET